MIHQASVSMLTLVGAVILGIAGSESAIAQPAPAKGRWEYAVLVRTSNLSTGEASVQFRQPGKTIDAKSLKSLGEQLGHSVPEESGAVLLNALGDQSWELAGYAERESIRDARLVATTWIFKRPK